MARHFIVALAGIGAGALAAMASTAKEAQPPDSVNVDVAACQALETRQAQIECYGERVEATLRTLDTESSAQAQTQARAPAAPSDERDRPSQSAPQHEQAAADENEHASSEPAENVVAKVVRLREIEPNAYLIYLDNDQIWRQNRPRRYALQVGAEVRLKPTRWGTSYRLTDPSLGGFIQVERIQ